MRYTFMGTEGPWRVGYGHGLSGDVISWQWFLDEHDNYELPISVGHEAICVINYSEDEIRHQRNAQLIAAAPELFEACAEFVRKVDEGEAQSTHSYRQMKAALKKATGEE